MKNWSEQYIQLSKAKLEHTINPKELETLATAAYLTGRDDECREILLQLHHDYLNQDIERALWCAFWLGMLLLMTGKHAEGSGWIARGERLLIENDKDCVVKGLLLIPAALAALSAGNIAKAQALFEEASMIGERFSDSDLTAFGRLGRGQIMIQKGNVANGIKMLDEVMVSMETEDIFPIARGIIYCAVIESCRKVWDIKRTKEWTLVLSRWCDAQPELIPFRGQCLVRRAEIMQLYGEWNKALEESQNACKLLTRPPGEPAAGESHYRKAELHRLLGDFEEAENNYREAAKWGRKPQPGLALLRLVQEQTEAAKMSINNALKETKAIKDRAGLLPATVRIMLVANQIEEARLATDELQKIATSFDVPFLYAELSHALGTVYFTEGDYRKALDHLQEAVKRWNDLDMPYESARSREIKGLAYRELGDHDSMEMELAAAKWVFEQLGAVTELKRVNQFMNKELSSHKYGLTLRELQVLRQLVSGKTNKCIAGELFISERTVDRHVSNIFNKLGLSSRVAATAFAIKHKIVENEQF